MTVELRPLGVTCNLQCHYCYQNPQRDAGNLGRRYDIEEMKAAIKAEGGPFSLFGGEPLLVPKADLEELWAWGLAEFGRNAIQTNGALIDDDHLRMFRDYKVNVGISIDGPEELNDARWQGSLERTRAATAATELAIERLCSEGRPPSIILTLHRANATAEKLTRLLDWVRDLSLMGVRWLRLHVLEVEGEQIAAKYALSNEENISVLLRFLDLEAELTETRFDLFSDMRKMLVGNDEQTTCIWNGCDQYTTQAVRGVEGHGQRSNCGRTNKDGIDFVKSDRPGFERYLALYSTPQEDGGCKGCRFFLMCKGQCPGTAIDGDWRNRTEHCSVWMSLYERLEAELIAAGVEPLSVSELRGEVERAVIESWSQGRQPTIARVLTGARFMDNANLDWRAELRRVRSALKRTDPRRRKRELAGLR